MFNKPVFQDFWAIKLSPNTTKAFKASHGLLIETIGDAAMLLSYREFETWWDFCVSPPNSLSFEDTKQSILHLADIAIGLDVLRQSSEDVKTNDLNASQEDIDNELILRTIQNIEKNYENPFVPQKYFCIMPTMRALYRKLCVKLSVDEREFYPVFNKMIMDSWTVTQTAINKSNNKPLFAQKPTERKKFF